MSMKKDFPHPQAILLKVPAIYRPKQHEYNNLHHSRATR